MQVYLQHPEIISIYLFSHHSSKSRPTILFENNSSLNIHSIIHSHQWSWGSWPTLGTQSPRDEVTIFVGDLRTETRPEIKILCLPTIPSNCHHLFRSLFSGWKFGRNAIHTMKSTIELVVCCHLCWKRCAAVKLGIISHIFRVNRNPPTFWSSKSKALFFRQHLLHGLNARLRLKELIELN